MGWFSNLFGGNSTANSNTGSVGSVHQGAGGPGGMTGGEAFQSGIISAAERREQLLADAAAAQQSGQDYSYNTDEFTGHNLGLGNEETAGKIREGLTSSEYADFMQQLHGNNPSSMQQAFPFSSGNVAQGIAKAVTGGLFPGGGLIMNALGQAQDAGANLWNKLPTGAIDAGFDFIQDNFMTSGSITEKPEEVDQFKNYLNNLKGLNDAAMNAGVSPFITQPGPDLTDRDGVVQRDPNQITVDDVSEQGLDAFFGGQSQTDSFEDFDRRIPPKKTTQDYIDEFNEQFNLDEKKEIFGIEGKEIITPGGVEVSDSITSGITPFNQKSFSEKLEMAPTVYQKLYERMSGEMNMTDAEIEKNLRRIGSSPSNMFPYFPFKSGGITRL